MVSTSDFESGDPSSNLGRTFLIALTSYYNNFGLIKTIRIHNAFIMVI